MNKLQLILETVHPQAITDKGTATAARFTTPTWKWPTYDDMPDVILLPSFEDKRSDAVPSHYPLKSELIDSSAELPKIEAQNVPASHTASQCEFKKYSLTIPYTQRIIKTLGQEHCSIAEATQNNIPCKSTLTTSQGDLSSSVNAIPHQLPVCTLPISLYSSLPSKHTSYDTPHTPLYFAPTKNSFSDCKTYGMWTKCPSAEVTTTSTDDLQKRQLNSESSCLNMVSGLSCGKQTPTLRNPVLGSHLETNASVWKKNIQLQCQEPVSSEGEINTVDVIVEEAIRTHCHGTDDLPGNDDNESISSFNIKSLLGCADGSSLSFDWNAPLQSEEDKSKPVVKNLDLLRAVNVNLNEDYKSKLTSVLSSCPLKKLKYVKAESEEAIVTALPHVPPSFVGKTWSQIMYEDDLKIEALVKQFKRGKFHCYFESDSVSNWHRKIKTGIDPVESDIIIKDQKQDLKELEASLPSVSNAPCADDDSDVSSFKHESVLSPDISKPAKRTWRLASRCQVVKVSHGTQTSLVNYPVINGKSIINDMVQNIDDFEVEKTPDMKTKMCALKLPESYTKILTPVQPKTMVYVLSSPDSKLYSGKPVSALKKGRNQCSTDSRDPVIYTYKQSPLKYYDPVTNRILKSPPKNSVRGLGTKGPCVRKLFRSLSSDVNVDKLDTELKDSTASKKSFSTSSVTSFYFDSVKGKDANSSLKGSGASFSTEISDCVKSENPDKPYAHTSPLSPCNVSLTKEKKDILSITKTKTPPSGPKRGSLLQRRDAKKSKCKINQLAESKYATNSKIGQQGLVNNKGGLEREQVYGARNKKSLKSSVPLAKAYRARQKTVNKSRMNKLPASKRVKSRLASQTSGRNKSKVRNNKVLGNKCSRASKQTGNKLLPYSLRKNKSRDTASSTRTNSKQVKRKRSG
ncbi:DBF4-type zinc finger-containing protein 2 isoform X2 [Xenopus laevis]|uniref:DBF4-type zinc finger-containing protein 2 isoform X2 n=1 Tax=Xenopus laevis TaxID=8355 RepID=A0A8J1LS31_XENLA|nr:DBF4-type zinc finger-containing protein 2 isoform X2 [Xenopus laevis]